MAIPRYGAQRRVDRGRVHARRRVLAEHGQHLTAEEEGADRDEDRDRGGDEGVPPGVARQRDEHAGADDPDRADGVGHHLEVGALHVQALAGTSAQQPERHQVDQQPETTDHQHRAGRDGHVVADPAGGLDADVGRGAEHQQHGEP
jgi:hypothetical protein